MYGDPSHFLADGTGMEMSILYTNASWRWPCALRRINAGVCVERRQVIHKVVDGRTTY